MASELGSTALWSQLISLPALALTVVGVGDCSGRIRAWVSGGRAYGWGQSEAVALTTTACGPRSSEV